MSGAPNYHLHYICGHHELNPHPTTALKHGTTWTKAASGDDYHGNAAQMFCLRCASALGQATETQHSYFLACGHMEGSDEALQMWWALQKAGLIKPGQDKLNMDCRDCEQDDMRLVRSLLESWSRRPNTVAEGNGSWSNQGPIRVPELARVLSYAQRSRRKSPDVWREFRELWVQVWARTISHADLLRFLAVLAELWGPAFMMEMGAAVGSEYFTLLRRRIDADVSSRGSRHVPGADKVSARVGQIRIKWATLDGIFRDIKVELQIKYNAYPSLGGRSKIKKPVADLDKTLVSLFDAGRKLQNAALQPWGGASAAVKVEEAELVKTSVRLDGAMRNLDRWMNVDIPDVNSRLDELMHSIANGREAALRLWIGNMALIHDMVVKAQAQRHEG
ncbi:hypothetical protein BJ166DRAFT_322212 [Pestalotiopsis sp. NC0098]|nr:hypothetical protein BJ166DRAFT_322212 [Pestalotiopsis sp. NC0098]